MLWWCMKMQADEYPGPGHFMCVDRGLPVGVWWRRLGPRLERTHALCEPCVSRRGLSPPACGRRTRAELHIQGIRPRMLPHARASRRRASCTHPCCSFPICSALRVHGTLHSPGRSYLLRLCPMHGLPLRDAKSVHKKRTAGEDGENGGSYVTSVRENFRGS
jgi:hypothetical protein